MNPKAHLAALSVSSLYTYNIGREQNNRVAETVRSRALHRLLTRELFAFASPATAGSQPEPAVDLALLP